MKYDKASRKLDLGRNLPDICRFFYTNKIFGE